MLAIGNPPNRRGLKMLILSRKILRWIFLREILKNKISGFCKRFGFLIEMPKYGNTENANKGLSSRSNFDISKFRNFALNNSMPWPLKLKYSLVCLLLLFAISFSAGCGNQANSGSTKQTTTEKKISTGKKTVTKKKPAAQESQISQKKEVSEKAAEEKSTEVGQEKAAPTQKPNSASLGDLLKQPVDSASRMIPDYPRIEVDEQKAAAAGIRKIAGKRITLYTDVPGEEIDRLPAVFELAFPQYCSYFRVDPATLPDWHATGFLMKDKKRFEDAGCYPAALPNFPNGFSWNYDLWLYDQKSDYYRRHLLIHEGVHSFMNTVLGGCGAPWYMEGMAEMLATHRYRDGKLTLNYFPQNREEVPDLGRIRIIHDDLAADRGLLLKKIIEYPSSAHHSNDAYAWSWAAAKFLDTQPRYQKRFRELPKDVLSPDFNANFYKIFADDLPEMYEEWQAFIADLEYGDDIPRTVIDFTPGKPLEEGKSTMVAVAADRGWQNSGLWLEGGRTYEITASGRWKKTVRPEFWTSVKNIPEEIELEPGGVSIRYYHGQPLGILQAVVRPDHPNSEKPAVFLHPTIAGLKATLTPEESGTLYFKINDTVADFSSNEGGIEAEIRQP